MVVVEGDAGIGKTRLVEMFTAAAAVRGARVVVGWCPPLVEDLPYAPVLEIVRQLGEPAGTERTGDRRRFFQQVADLLAGQATATVAVVEDLHRADGSTRDLLAFLAWTLRDSAVLLILTVRGDDLTAAHPVAALLAELPRGSLDPPAHQVLRAAAVIGRSSDHRLLAAVAGLAAESLDAATAQAVEHSLLLPVGEGYRFRHELVRETIYAALLPGERARLHARVAAALQARLAGSHGDAAAVHLAEVAHHFDAAGQAPEALGASARAAVAAREAAGPAEAHAQYERVLRLWPEVADAPALAGTTRHALLVEAAAMASAAGDNLRARDLVGTALLEVDRTADPLRAAVLLERHGRYAWLASATDESQRSYEEAALLVKGQQPSAEQAGVLAAMAQCLMLRSRPDAAIAYAEEAIEIARKLGATAVLAHASNTLGRSLCHLRRNDEGLGVLREALATAIEAADPAEICRVSFNLAWALMAAGRLEEALAQAREGGPAPRPPLGPGRGGRRRRPVRRPGRGVPDPDPRVWWHAPSRPACLRAARPSRAVPTGPGARPDAVGRAGQRPGQRRRSISRRLRPLAAG